MIELISCTLILIFTILAGIHFYWLFGGKAGIDVAVPSIDDKKKVLNPGFFSIFIVAIGFLVFALIIYINSYSFNLPQIIKTIGRIALWGIAGIFLLRSIGDFHYVGFFKKVKMTKFGKNDTKYYSPLCLMISLLTILLVLNIF